MLYTQLIIFVIYALFYIELISMLPLSFSFLSSCRYGPLIRHWTMRFEAKHAYFKALAQSLDNFINLPHSLAMRHQHLLCYLSTNHHELPGMGLEVGPGM